VVILVDREDVLVLRRWERQSGQHIDRRPVLRLERFLEAPVELGQAADTGEVRRNAQVTGS
jgi:hypothetical protein